MASKDPWWDDIDDLTLADLIDDPEMPSLDEIAIDLEIALGALEDLGWRDIASDLKAVIKRVDEAIQIEEMLDREAEQLLIDNAICSKKKKKKSKTEAKPFVPVIERRLAMSRKTRKEG